MKNSGMHFVKPGFPCPQKAWGFRVIGFLKGCHRRGGSGNCLLRAGHEKTGDPGSRIFKRKRTRLPVCFYYSYETVGFPVGFQ